MNSPWLADTLMIFALMRSAHIDQHGLIEGLIFGCDHSSAGLRAPCRRFQLLGGGVRTKAIWESTLMDDEVSRVIYRDYLPAALEAGRHLALPEALVAGLGLEAIQSALDRHRAGVSTRKVVATLQ